MQEQVARHTSALAIAKVAAIELPVKQWQELIPKLLESMQTPTGGTGLKQATLETFGYVCEEMGHFDEVILDQEQVNNVLTAVVQGTAQQEDKHVRLAAITALFNALEFAHTNFENDGERDYLMQVICQCTTDAMVQIRERSFECLVRIAALHYDKLRPYMQEIFNLVQRAVTDQEEDVAKQGIEFWCTVCEEEIDVQAVSPLPPSSCLWCCRIIMNSCMPRCIGLLCLHAQRPDEQPEGSIALHLSSVNLIHNKVCN